MRLNVRLVIKMVEFGQETKKEPGLEASLFHPEALKSNTSHRDVHPRHRFISSVLQGGKCVLPLL